MGLFGPDLILFLSIPEASSDDRKCADVPAAKLVQVDRGKSTTLNKN